MKKAIKAFLALFFLIITVSGALAAETTNKPEIKTVDNYVAVFDFGVTTGDKGISRPLADSVIHEFSQSDKYEVIDRSNMNKILGEQKFQMSGCVVQECKVEAGQILGVGKIINGSVGIVGKTYYLTLQLIDVKTGKVELSAEDECKCEIDELLGSTRRLAKKLLGEKVEQHAKTASKISNSIGMTFVYIKPGTFMMGSPSNEPGRDKGETQHQVTLTRGFYMQTTEVTQGQWRTVMGDNPSAFNNCGNECPVELVSWNDAQEFIRRLNQKELVTSYRLPTEAEWEYAARAGTTTPFNTGNCLSTDQANYNGDYPLSGCSNGEYRKKTVRTGSFSPNAWGLYDMHGNVWEWVQDWYEKTSPSGSVTDPAGPSTSGFRVFRGGGWRDDAKDCRSAIRRFSRPEVGAIRLGFRLSKTP